MADWEIVRLGPDYRDLARYNAEVARGIVHTDEWAAKMAELQARFDAEQRDKLIDQGMQVADAVNWVYGPCTPAPLLPWWKRWRRG